VTVEAIFIDNNYCKFLFSICQAILAAVVVVALKGLFRQFSRLVQLWRICKPDAVSEVPYSASNPILVAQLSRQLVASGY